MNKEDAPSTNAVNSRRKKKFTGGNASKRHRDRVNVEFNNLAQLLPFPESVIVKLDKSSILRLAVSYIRAKSFFKGASVQALCRETLSSLIKEGTGVVTEIFSKALDGFLLVLTEDMRVLFVSETVRDYLGYCQAGIIHESFLQFVNPADHAIARASVNYRENEDENSQTSKSRTSKVDETKGQPTVRRRFICRMKCAYSCSSRFYTAYRTFEFSGHLRNSKIQEGKDEKELNTLVVFATPLSNNKHGYQDCSDGSDAGDVKETFEMNLPDKKDFTPYDTYASGFRIEPTLRPHVAPIPVTSKEQSEIRAFNEASFRHRLSRPPPSLINVAENFPRDLPRLIKRERVQTMTVFSNNHPTYNDMFTCDSRSSDHSDDSSKYSPVSSPNLPWRQRNANAGFVVSDDRAIKKHELNTSVIKANTYKWCSRSPDLEISRLCSGDPSNSLDVYSRNSIQRSVHDARYTGYPTNFYSYEMRNKKRLYYEEYPTEDIAVSYKKQKISQHGKKNNFNISSILGLEEETSSACLSRAKENSQIVYNVYR